MKQLYLLFLKLCSIIIFVSCNSPVTPASQEILAQNPKVKRDTLTKVWIDSVDKIITLGYQDKYDKLPKLKFVKISANDFLKFKSRFQNNLNRDPYKLDIENTTFTIQTAKSKLKYNRQFNDSNYIHRVGYLRTNYIGYNDVLKLYVLENWVNTGEFTLGDSFFIDSISNIKYELVSHSDSPFEPIVISPNNHFIITYVSDIIDDDRSFIGVIKVNENNTSNKYEEYTSVELKGMLIDDLVWINDNSFAIKINQRTYNDANSNWIDNFTYAKADLPKS